ncbi:hypothetical protein ES703_82102 [subsurface metagenome]
MVTCQSSGNEIYFKSKNVGGTFKIYLYNANPDTGALIGDILDIHSETVTTGEAHIWTDLTGLEGEISSGNTFAFKMSFTPTDTTSSDLETKFGAYGESGKQLLFNVQESAAYVAPSCKFEYRRPIVIDHTKVGVDDSGTLPATGFPVLVSLSGNWLKTTLVDATNGRIENANGYDIIFRESDGRAGLYHEIEEYDGTTGTLVAWVRIDSFSMGPLDTTIYIYYGNSCITSPTEDPANVWDDSFAGVWHLEEQVTDDAAGGTHDDSADVHDGTQQYNGPIGGQIAGAQTFDSTGDCVDIADHVDLSFLGGDGDGGADSPFSVSAWINGDTDDAEIVSKNSWPGASEWDLWSEGGKISLMLYDTGVDYIGRIAQTGITAGWHYVTGTYDGSNSDTGIKVFIDGVEQATDPYSGGTYDGMSNTLINVQIGSNDGGSQESFDFNGQIDEVRVSSTARDLDWIATSFNN